MNPRIGTTYSHPHMQYLKVPHEVAFTELLNLRFAIIRLGCYWRDVETIQGKYDFSRMHRMLEECEKADQEVVLTVGMKAPRWPEYYFPQWLPTKDPQGASEKVLLLLEKTVTELSSYSCITYWQVENEPLDPSGPQNLRIPQEVLRQEVALIRSIDKRPLILNLWGNALSKRGFFPQVAALADIIGLDLYYKVPFGRLFYSGPLDSDKKITAIGETTNKPVWITELQAEPWEQQSLAAFSDEPSSMNAKLLQKNFERASAMLFPVILLWGFEYWLMKKLQGDDRLWNAAQACITRTNSQ